MTSPSTPDKQERPATCPRCKSDDPARNRLVNALGREVGVACTHAFHAPADPGEQEQVTDIESSERSFNVDAPQQAGEQVERDELDRSTHSASRARELRRLADELRAQDRIWECKVCGHANSTDLDTCEACGEGLFRPDLGQAGEKGKVYEVYVHGGDYYVPLREHVRHLQAARDRADQATQQQATWIECPNAAVCQYCPCAAEDDACFPGDRLRAELAHERQLRKVATSRIETFTMRAEAATQQLRDCKQQLETALAVRADDQAFVTAQQFLSEQKRANRLAQQLREAESKRDNYEAEAFKLAHRCDEVVKRQIEFLDRAEAAEARAEQAEERVREADDLLRRLDEWDTMRIPKSDGPYWRSEIARARAALSPKGDDDG